MTIESGAAQHIALAEHVCGDGYLVTPTEEGLLIAVVDGLGHGEQAAIAAQAFIEAVRENPDLGLPELMRECHQRLSGTRGAAGALVRIDRRTRRIAFVGVGNIHFHALSDGPMHPVSAPGIVGHRIRKIIPFEYDLPRRTLIVLASDGVSSRLELEEYGHLGPQEVADIIVSEHGKAHDDATVVTVRYLDEGEAA